MPEDNSNPPEKASPQTPDTKSDPKNKTLLMIVVLVGLLVSLAVAGYFVQSQSSKTSNSQSGSDASTSAVGQSATESANSAATGKDKVPSSFPKDITVYKDAKIAASSETTNAVSVILKTNDPSDSAVAFYKSDLQKNKWKTTNNTASTGISFLQAEKGNKTAVITVSPDPDEEYKTMITISVQTTP